MPKLKLTPTQERDRTFEALVRYHAMLLGLSTDAQIAEYLGLPPSTFRYRMHNKSAWSYDELSRMFKKLRFPKEQIGEVF